MSKPDKACFSQAVVEPQAELEEGDTDTFQSIRRLRWNLILRTEGPSAGILARSEARCESVPASVLKQNDGSPRSTPLQEEQIIDVLLGLHFDFLFHAMTV